MLIAATLNPAVQLNDQVCVFGAAHRGGALSKGGSRCHNIRELLCFSQLKRGRDHWNVRGRFQASLKLHRFKHYPVELQTSKSNYSALICCTNVNMIPVKCTKCTSVWFVEMYDVLGCNQRAVSCLCPLCLSVSHSEWSLSPVGRQTRNLILAEWVCLQWMFDFLLRRSDKVWAKHTLFTSVTEWKSDVSESQMMNEIIKTSWRWNLWTHRCRWTDGVSSAVKSLFHTLVWSLVEEGK